MVEGGYAVRTLEVAERGDHVVMTAWGPGLREACGKRLDGQVSFMFTLNQERAITRMGAFAQREDAFAAADKA